MSQSVTQGGLTPFFLVLVWGGVIALGVHLVESAPRAVPVIERAAVPEPVVAVPEPEPVPRPVPAAALAPDPAPVPVEKKHRRKPRPDRSEELDLLPPAAPKAKVQ